MEIKEDNVKNISRRAFLGSATVLGTLGAFPLAGCSSSGSSGAGASGAGSSDASGSGSAQAPSSGSAGAQGANHFTIGTLATEDILPYWVAREQGMFEAAGLDVDIVTFQSATELIAGVASGEVDLAMTDIMVAASMFAGGTDIQMRWVTLGTTPEQGRFGIMVNGDSDVKSLSDLAGVPIGVGSNTILEYVMDKLMEQAGVPADQVVVEELQKLPVRYQVMESGEVAAAALPGSLLALGEANGCRTVADDTKGDNLSQSVMVVQTGVANDSERGPRIADLQDIWDEAARLINENPEAYRGVLVANANLSEAVADTYPISEYPLCELPTSAMVEPVLEWMQQKGYLSGPLSYDEKTGAFSM